MGTVNLKAIISPIIAAGTKSSSRVNAPSSIRGPAGQKLLGGQLSNSLAGDLEGLSESVNDLQKKLQTPPTISQILLTNAQGQVTAAFGNLTFEGVVYVNYLSEIHVGNPFQGTNPSDPRNAVFNANTDGSVSIGNTGWLDVHDPFDGNAAWIGTQNDTLVITNAVQGPGNVIRLTVPGHTLVTGNSCTVRNMNLVNVPNADGVWTVTVINTTTVDLQRSVWSGPFTPIADPPSGLTTFQPTIDRVLQITGVTNAGGLFRIKTAVAHGYESGSAVNIPAPEPGGVPNTVGQWIISVPATLPVTGAVNNGGGLIRLTVVGHNFVTGDRPRILAVGGVPAANGWFVITVIDASHIDLQGSVFAGAYTSGGTITFLHANVFDLVGSTFAGTYSSGGTVLAYFAGILAQTIAVGPSFGGYKLRAFPSGDLRIRNAIIDLSSTAGEIVLDPTTARITLTSTANLAEIILDATVPSITFTDATGTTTTTLNAATGGTTSSIGTAPNVLSASLIDGKLLVSGTGTQAGKGLITIDQLELAGLAAAPTAPGAGEAILYYDDVLAALYYNLAGAGWVKITAATAGGAVGDVQFNDGAGGFSGNAAFNWNGAVLTITGGGISADAVVGNTSVSVGGGGAFNAGANTGFTGTLAAAIAAGKNVVGGIIVN